MPYETNDAFAAHFCEAGKTAPPRFLDVRFDADGRFLPMPGNTVVCAVAPDSPTDRALARLRRGLMALPYGDRFAYTPMASWHMTVFNGVIDDRRVAHYWPASLPFDAAIDRITAWHLDRLRGFAPPASFRMKLKEVTPLGLVVAGATAQDHAMLRAWRDRLAAPFDYRHPDDDDYTFHITLAYQKAWLPDGAEDTYLPALAALGRDFAAAAPVLDLGPPEFCVFADMTEFQPILDLGRPMVDHLVIAER